MSFTPAQLEQAQALRDKIEAGEDPSKLSHKVEGHIHFKDELADIPEEVTHPSQSVPHGPASLEKKPADFARSRQAVPAAGEENLKDAVFGVNKGEEITALPDEAEGEEEAQAENEPQPQKEGEAQDEAQTEKAVETARRAE